LNQWKAPGGCCQYSDNLRSHRRDAILIARYHIIMRLYLVRHGIAEDPSLQRPDSARALTAPGIERLRLQGRALRRAGFAVDVILSSPLVRAVQTAEILGQTLGIAPQEESLLGPGCRVADVQEILS